MSKPNRVEFRVTSGEVRLFEKDTSSTGDRASTVQSGREYTIMPLLVTTKPSQNRRQQFKRLNRRLSGHTFQSEGGNTA
mgnify:CR=1 FL=1